MIKIAGAGISGLTSAINLALKGYKVTVYEQGKHPGGRFDSDWQFLENWSKKQDILKYLKSINIKINFLCRPINRIELLINNKKIPVKTSKTIMYAVLRGKDSNSIDNGLYQQAKSLGVKFVFGKALSQKEADIFAAGPRRPDAYILGYYYKTEQKNKIIAVYDQNFSIKGYTYLIQINGIGNLVITEAREKCQKEILDKLKKHLEKDYKVEIKKKRLFGKMANAFFANKYFVNNTYYTGEAAGLQDALAGFGIRFAFKSGYLCSQAIINNLDYDKLIKKNFLKDIKILATQRKLLVDLNLANRFIKIFLKFNMSHHKGDTLIKALKYLYNLKINLVLFPLLYFYTKFANKKRFHKKYKVNLINPFSRNS